MFASDVKFAPKDLLCNLAIDAKIGRFVNFRYA